MRFRTQLPALLFAVATAISALPNVKDLVIEGPSSCHLDFSECNRNGGKCAGRQGPGIWIGDDTHIDDLDAHGSMIASEITDCWERVGKDGPADDDGSDNKAIQKGSEAKEDVKALEAKEKEKRFRGHWVRTFHRDDKLETLKGLLWMDEWRTERKRNELARLKQDQEGLLNEARKLEDEYCASQRYGPKVRLLPHKVESQYHHSLSALKKKIRTAEKELKKLEKKQQRRREKIYKEERRQLESGKEYQQPYTNQGGGTPLEAKDRQKGAAVNIILSPVREARSEIKENEKKEDKKENKKKGKEKPEKDEKENDWKEVEAEIKKELEALDESWRKADAKEAEEELIWEPQKEHKETEEGERKRTEAWPKDFAWR